MINITDILTLDDNNKYVVVSKVNYENKNYYYLVDINNKENLMFCYEENDQLVELNNKNISKKIIPLFIEEASKTIDVNRLKEYIEKNS